MRALSRRPSELGAAVSAALLGLVGCACNPAPADVPDAWTDPRESYVFELTPGTPCEPWPDVPHPGLGQPLAPPGEPFVVWEWSPVGDPILAALPSNDSNSMEGVSLGPDGSLWAITPNSTIITSIDHEGRTAWARQVVPLGLWMNGIPFGPITRLPDGSGYFDWAGPLPDTTEFWVIHLGADGEELDRRAIPGMPGTDLTNRRWMAVTADGGVLYESDAVTAQLVKSCPGRDEPAWTLYVRRTGGGEYNFDSPRPIPMADGTLFAPVFDALARIDTSGELMEWIGPLYPDAFPAPAWYAADTWVVGSGRASVRHVETMTPTGMLLWQGPDGMTDWRVDPLARLWRAEEPERGVIRDRYGAIVRTEPPGLSPSYRGVWGADGSVFATAEGDLRSIVRVDGTTGEILWQLQVGAEGDAASPLLLDVDGRLYVQLQGSVADGWGIVHRIAAIQTDVRAPRDVCIGHPWAPRCNRHGNGAAWDYGPRPFE